LIGAPARKSIVMSPPLLNDGSKTQLGTHTKKRNLRSGYGAAAAALERLRDLSRRFARCGFVLLLVVAECLQETTKDFGGSLEPRFELRLIDLCDVFAQMVLDFLQRHFHFLSVMTRVTVGTACHDCFLGCASASRPQAGAIHFNLLPCCGFLTMTLRRQMPSGVFLQRDPAPSWYGLWFRAQRRSCPMLGLFCAPRIDPLP
jgi:hypothetical protein